MCVTVRAVVAFDGALLKLDDLRGPDWSVQQIRVTLDWLTLTRAAVTLRAAHASLPEPLGKLDSITLTCPSLQYDGAEISCAAGELKAQSGLLGPQQVRIRFRYALTNQSLEVKLDDVRYGGGRVLLAATYQAPGWTARITANDVLASAFSAQAHALGFAGLPALQGEGRVDLQARLQGNQAGISELKLDLQVNNTDFTNDAGSIAGEQVKLQAAVQLASQPRGWRIHTQLAVQGGAVYFDPVYVQVTGQPVTLDTSFDWNPRSGQIQLHRLRYRQPDAVELQAQGELAWKETLQLQQLDLVLDDVTLPAAYETYLQPWLGGTSTGTLQTTGHLQGRVRLGNNQPEHVQLSLRDVSIEQRDALFGMSGINASLDWDAQDTRVSQLAWQSGHVYRIGLGASQVSVETTGKAARLVEPAQLPVLDGMLEIDSFQLARDNNTALRWEVDGLLTPVSMQQLTAALEWPEFGGKLSGVIPKVRYENGILSIGGVLLVRVFDGEVTLRDLVLEAPLGQVPRLQVDASARNIDLEALTRTFSFGRIEGRLDGRVDGLRMESWEPVAFDAEFITPPNDRSRHRISQKAVDNIANIGGGGVSGALSRSFLRFLEDFPYDRLGIRCRLENGVCAMSGVEPARQGYYIVKGRFIPPRLDVIGFSDRVDWKGLVSQVIQVTRGKGPVVQ